MRILNVTQTYAPFLEFGGPPEKVRALSEELARRGHEVTVLTSDWGVEERNADGDLERSPFGWRTRKNGVQAIYLPAWLRYRALSWNPAAGRFCRARLNQFDVVHIFGLYDLLGPRVATICRQLNKPYVVEPMGMYVPIVRSFALKRLYHLAIGGAMLREAEFLIATSEQEAGELREQGQREDKIVLRRNGVERPASWPEHGRFRSAQGIAKEAKLILFLGRMSRKKSPELLLEAFERVNKRWKGAELQLVFAGPDEDGMQRELAELARKMGLAPQVKFAGGVYGEQKWSAYRDADVFVLPSQNENFGNTAAEAVAAGTPAVITEGCGIAPLLKDMAALVTAHEAGEIAAAMERILGDTELRTRLAKGCAAATERLGWQEPAHEMETLYARLVPAERRVA